MVTTLHSAKRRPRNTGEDGGNDSPMSDDNEIAITPIQLAARRRRHKHDVPAIGKQQVTKNCRISVDKLWILLMFLAAIVTWITFQSASPTTATDANLEPLHKSSLGEASKQRLIQKEKDPSAKRNRKVVTAFLEPPSPAWQPQDSDSDYPRPLPRRLNSRSDLVAREFPKVGRSCATLTASLGTEVVNTFGTTPAVNSSDPFLPWIHDYFVSSNDDKSDGSSGHDLRLQFVGQNRRNCDTGKDRTGVMQFWAPQMALFQPIPVVRTDYRNGTSRFRLYGDGLLEDKLELKRDASVDVLREQLISETRFVCRFHWRSDVDKNHDATSSITHSTFDFNYEYVSWRKKSVMMAKGSTKRSEFWNSQLLFSCPIPKEFQETLRGGLVRDFASPFKDVIATVLVDVIPIRTPPRYDKKWLTPHMIGAVAFSQIKTTSDFFNIQKEFGVDHVLPPIAESGRWANLPVCPREIIPRPKIHTPNELLPITTATKKPHRLVLCTWTSASYHRRGEDDDQEPLNDNSLRLREWLIFHKLVGFDHVYIYDNTPPMDGHDYSSSSLYQLVQEFDSSFVTLHPWPATICNNNRPGNKNPGDRSSQYAAEATCRERYGPLTDWMAFIDTDEYLTPMKVNETGGESTTWMPILDDMERRGAAIMKFKSGRNFPRIHLMEHIANSVTMRLISPNLVITRPLANQKTCGDPVTEHFLKGIAPEPCLGPRQGETFLRVYNCDSIKRPRPERFQRAMKQIYRPDYVQSHFVHYSTVTEFNTRYYDPNNPIPAHLKRERFDPDKEVFVDEMTEGTLIHARSVVPHETMFRSTVCQVGYKKMNCFLGYECPDSVEWMDDLDRAKGGRTKTNMNPHHDENGIFCSCWVNHRVEEYWIPKLEEGLAQHMTDISS